MSAVDSPLLIKISDGNLRHSKWVMHIVTRFAEILQLWQSLQVFGKFLTVYFLFGKLLSIFCQIVTFLG